MRENENNLIYIVEDEQDIAEIIGCAISTSGYKFLHFISGEDFFYSLKNLVPTLILLDVMLPDESGLSILGKLKANDLYKDIPVIFLTAKSSEPDKVKGLNLGADDYITKPFGVLELIARINAVLRRTRKNDKNLDETSYKYKNLFINTETKEVIKDGKNLNLTYKEYQMLTYLHKNIGLVISRESLLSTLWDFDFDGETRTVDAHIKSLRQKLNDNADSPIYIATLRGHGYKLLKE